MAPGPAKRTAAPGGPCQYYAVQQYSVVCRAWGPRGVAMFLICGASTRPRNLMAVILTTPVCCTLSSGCIKLESGGVNKPKGSAPITVLQYHMPSPSLEMLIPRVNVTQALCISASTVFNFLALVLMLKFCSKAVS